MVKSNPSTLHISYVCEGNVAIRKCYLSMIVELEFSNLLMKALNDPKSHAPKWHEFSLMKHIDKTIEAAMIIRDKSSVNIDLTEVMALHDVGKITDFIHYCRKGPSTEHFQEYNGHEIASSKIAEKIGVSAETQFLIENHALGCSAIKSNIMPDDLFEKCGKDKQLLIKLLLVFACDAYGKGWTLEQITQRGQLMSYVNKVINEYELPEWVWGISSDLIMG